MKDEVTVGDAGGDRAARGLDAAVVKPHVVVARRRLDRAQRQEADQAGDAPGSRRVAERLADQPGEPDRGQVKIARADDPARGEEREDRDGREGDAEQRARFAGARTPDRHVERDRENRNAGAPGERLGKDIGARDDVDDAARDLQELAGEGRSLVAGATPPFQHVVARDQVGERR